MKISPQKKEIKKKGHNQEDPLRRERMHGEENLEFINRDRSQSSRKRSNQKPVNPTNITVMNIAETIGSSIASCEVNFSRKKPTKKR